MKRTLWLIFSALTLAASTQTGLSTQAGTQSISGQLRSAGQPAPGVRVMALDQDGPASVIASATVTDATGHYHLDGLRPSRYFIAAGLLDYPSYYPGVLAIGDAKVVTLRPGSAANIDFPIALGSIGFKLSGRVRLPTTTLDVRDRMMLSNLTLSLKDSTDAARRFTAQIKKDGAFEFIGVSPPGTYTLMLYRPGTMPVDVTLSDKDVTGIELVAPQLTGVLTRVVVENDIPMPSVMMTLREESSGSLMGILGGGSREATPFPVGQYHVEINSRLPPGYFIKTITLNERDVTSAPITIEAGDSKRLTITLSVAGPPPWVNVRGKLVRPSGDPALPIKPDTQVVLESEVLEGIHRQINVESQGGGISRIRLFELMNQRSDELGNSSLFLPIPPPVKVDENGSFQFPKTPAGTYTLRVTPPTSDIAPVRIVVGKQEIDDVRIVVP